MKWFNGLFFECMFWLVALILLASSDLSSQHFTFCPLANLGVNWCPGCGIGHSISAFLQGRISDSFQAHWFGIPATLLILHRAMCLIKKNYNLNQFKISGGN